ncbi:hypothetical protein SLE2022_189600 [Rubroshorea leprosula]
MGHPERGELKPPHCLPSKMKAFVIATILLFFILIPTSTSAAELVPDGAATGPVKGCSPNGNCGKGKPIRCTPNQNCRQVPPGSTPHTSMP